METNKLLRLTFQFNFDSKLWILQQQVLKIQSLSFRLLLIKFCILVFKCFYKEITKKLLLQSDGTSIEDKDIEDNHRSG